MKVLILGASGFIGGPVADAFVRAGHIVYGQTRSEVSAHTLALREIIPVVCDPLTEQGRIVWANVADEADVVVDALKSSGAPNAIATLHTFLDAVSCRPQGSPKPTYIYCSGLWVMSKGPGSLSSWTDERQPRTSDNELVAWRAAIEDAVTSESHINGIVIRPGIVYGTSQSFVAHFILDRASAALSHDTTFETPGFPDTRWQTIHHDDAASLFLRVAERASRCAPICAGQTFLAANQASERLTDILDAVQRVSRVKGYKLTGGDAGYDKCWASTLNARPTLGTAITGWRAQKLSLVDGMDVYWTSYQASKRSPH